MAYSIYTFLTYTFFAPIQFDSGEPWKLLLLDLARAVIISGLAIFVGLGCLTKCLTYHPSDFDTVDSADFKHELRERARRADASPHLAREMEMAQWGHVLPRLKVLALRTCVVLISVTWPNVPACKTPSNGIGASKLTMTMSLLLESDIVNDYWADKEVLDLSNYMQQVLLYGFAVVALLVITCWKVKLSEVTPKTVATMFWIDTATWCLAFSIWTPW